MKRLGLLSLLLASACEVDTVRDTEPSSVLLLVSDGLTEAHLEVRYAVVFVLPGEFFVTADGPVEFGAVMAVPLLAPGGDWPTRLGAREIAVLPSTLEIPIYRPRLVIYEDVDGSGSFHPTIREGGVDRVLAVDGASSGPYIAIALDLDAALAKMSFEETQDYYAATGGVYTPFFRVQSEGGAFRLWRELDAGPLRLTATDSPLAAEHLACNRQPIYVYGDPAEALPVTAHVDVALSPVEVCGISITSCAHEELEALAPPEISEVITYALRRNSQCRSNAWLEVLLVHTAKLSCGGCQCNYETTTHAYFAAPGGTPSWWPCGEALAFCDSELPLYQLDDTCEPQGEP